MINQQTKSHSDIAKDYEKDVLAGELMDILEAVRTLKLGSGWGKIELVYLGSEVNDIDIHIKRKPKKQKPV